LLAVEAGTLAQAEEHARAAVAVVADPSQGLKAAPQSSTAYIAMGAVHAARGRLQEARHDLEHALQIRRRWPGIGPWGTVEVLLRLAPVLAGLGDRAEASALLAEARQVITSLPEGAGAQLARLERLERLGRHSAARPRAVALADPLTERERDVLRLLRGTLSLRDIAHELYVSQNTIKTHTQAIYRKLGVSDRRDAVAKARELGLI
jgi:LuxR family transcriptional regulator, maltose regulon positive regulatory protein